MLVNAQTAPKRGFTSSEYKTRTHNLQALMAEQGLGAVLITTEADMYYFTGYLSQFWQSPTRPWYVVIPSSGNPIAVIPEIGVNCMRSEFMQDIRSWSSPHPSDDGVSLLIDTLLDALSGLSDKRVGINMAQETHIRMPLHHYQQVERALKKEDIEFADATLPIRKLRMVKSEAEIAKLHYVAQCASNVFENLFSFVDLGMRDDEIFTAFKIECLKNGVDDVSFLVGGADQSGYDDIISPPNGKVLQKGDVLILDTGCTFDGYFCDFDRNYGFGHVDDACQKAYEVVWQATEAGLAKATPGSTCQDIFSAMDSVLKAGGAQGDSVGRYGHGLGIQLTEPPSHTAWDKTVLEPGMVLTLEPGMIFAPNKMMVHEENIVIREQGAELLSRRAEPQLPIKS